MRSIVVPTIRRGRHGAGGWSQSSGPSRKARLPMRSSTLGGRNSSRSPYCRCELTDRSYDDARGWNVSRRDRRPVRRRRPLAAAPAQASMPASTKTAIRSRFGAADRLRRTSSLTEMKQVLLASEHQRHCDSHLGHHQCATAAAAASSIRRPVRKRSMVKGALIGCGSSLAMVWAKTWPEPGVALKPPVPQPQLT